MTTTGARRTAWKREALSGKITGVPGLRCIISCSAPSLKPVTLGIQLRDESDHSVWLSEITPPYRARGQNREFRGTLSEDLP